MCTIHFRIDVRNTLPSDPGDCGLWLPNWRTCHARLVHTATPQDASELVHNCMATMVTMAAILAMATMGSGHPTEELVKLS